MAAFRPSRCWMSPKKGKLAQQAVRQHLAASGRTLEDLRKPQTPIIPKCPSPTCKCAEMPTGLDIDSSKDLNGTMASYSEQILIPTGQADWKSKIEDEKDTAPWGNVVAQIKQSLGPKGRFHDPYRNVVVSTCSFETTDTQPQALLFPSFSYITGIEPSESRVRQFLENFVISKELSGMIGGAQKELGAGQHIKPKANEWNGTVIPISAPTILICSHNSRDSRCGVLGPLLHAEFMQYIDKRHTLRNKVTADVVSHYSEGAENVSSYASHPSFQPQAIDIDNQNRHPINVGMISHIGGHKWAGNVIVYIPPDYRLQPLERQARGAKPKDKIVASKGEPVVPEDHALPVEEQNADLSPLAGKGIWYGRVQPKHVEGIVEQTIGRGNIIRELFRGGINQNGSMIRI